MINGNVTTPPEDAPVFTAELTPYRSLGRRGFRIFFLIAGLLSLVHAFVFLVIGAWPVVFFFGLDYLLLFGAFSAFQSTVSGATSWPLPSMRRMLLRAR